MALKIPEMFVIKLLLLTLLVDYISAQTTQIINNNNRNKSSTKKLFCSYNSYRNFSLSDSLLKKADTLCSYYLYNGVTLHHQNGLIIPNVTRFAAIKDYNKNAKLLLYAYPPIIEAELETALHKETRKPLIKRIIEQLRSNNLDGIGLHSDFAFSNKDNKPIQTETFSRDLKAAIDEEAALSKKPKLILLIYTGLISSFIEEKVNVTSLLKYFDWVLISNDNYFAVVDHMLTLRNKSNTELQSRNNRLLYTDDVFVNYFLNQGIKPEKLIFLIFSYGYEFTLPASNNGKSNGTSPNPTTAPFYKICEKLKTEVGWSVKHKNESAAGAYARRNDQWAVFQDVETVRTKTKYAMNKNLGGTVIVIPDDDYSGKCYNKMFPLTDAVKETMKFY